MNKRIANLADLKVVIDNSVLKMACINISLSQPFCKIKGKKCTFAYLWYKCISLFCLFIVLSVYVNPALASFSQ